MPLEFSSISALTFDCYGTLIDWEAGILRALRPLFTMRGLRPTDAELIAAYAALEAEQEQLAYRPYRDVLESVAEGVAARFGARLEEVERRRLPESVARWQPFPDTAAALKALAERFRLVVCSNIDDDLFEATNEKLGVEFERVVTGEYCRSYKPDPRHFRVALALLDLPPERVLHVAQSRYHDIAPAKAMGLHTCWINRASAVPDQGVAPRHPPGSEPDLELPDLASLARRV